VAYAQVKLNISLIKNLVGTCKSANHEIL